MPAGHAEHRADEKRSTARPRVAVSSCLLGEPVRFNGGHSRDRFVSGALSAWVDWVPICPEIEIGLGAPRETLHLEGTPEAPRMVTRTSRRDLTEPMTALAKARAAALRVDGYVFKAKSPTCGLHGVPVHGSGRRGRGLYASAMIEAHPLLPVEDEGRLHDDVLREAFVERVFAHARLRALLEDDWRARDLVSFHARHKMQLLAHDPAAYRKIGRLVAEAGTLPPERLAAAYGRAFRAALATRATVGRNANVLLHCLGMVSDGLDRVRRADMVEVIDAYRAHQVALSVPLALLRHHVKGTGVTYLAGQSYFSLYPDELGLRNHVA
ncbi:YbgA family protein [Sphaerisporangium dianthi]|uniref:YbgA family protein n=1 Tax=Sphaerisporangium dianthi TaxID=1436120 RepID=A0ABV9CQ65_9ACTN